MRFGSDIIVIYYSCNSRVVNLQQVLQRQWITWLWRHSQQRQQVSNVIIFWKLYAKLLFQSCFKTFFICKFNASKVIFIHFLFECRIACSFYRKTIRTDVKFWDSSVFWKPNPNRISVFCESLLSVQLKLYTHVHSYNHGDFRAPSNTTRQTL